MEIKSEKEKLELLLKELNLNRRNLSIELGYKNDNSIHRVYREETKLYSEPLFSKILSRFPFVSVDFLKNGVLPVRLTPEEQLIQDNLLYPNRSAIQDPISQTVAMMLFAEIKALREEIKDLKTYFKDKKQ